MAEGGYRVPLPDEEQRRLVQAAQAGDERARGILVECNLRLVRSVIQRFLGRGVEADDLFQMGCLGLVKAIERFDPAYGVHFSTFAVPAIIGEVRRYLRDDGPVRVSRRLKEVARSVELKRDELRGNLGREPSLGELAAAMGTGVEEIVAALDSARPLASLDATCDPEGAEGRRLMDLVAGEGDSAERWSDFLALREALGGLDRRERAVLLFRYYRDLTQAETARRIGLSQVQVSRIEKKALDKLRTALGGAERPPA